MLSGLATHTPDRPPIIRRCCQIKTKQVLRKFLPVKIIFQRYWLYSN